MSPAAVCWLTILCPKAWVNLHFPMCRFLILPIQQLIAVIELENFRSGDALRTGYAVKIKGILSCKQIAGT